MNAIHREMLKKVQRGDRGQHTYPQKLPQRVIQALKDPR